MAEKSRFHVPEEVQLYFKVSMHKKVLYLSVRVFSTVVLIVDTVNKQTNITNRTKIC